MSAIDEQMFVIKNEEDLEMFADEFGEGLVGQLGWYFFVDGHIEGPFDSYDKAELAFKSYYGITGA